MWKIRYLLPTIVFALSACGGDADLSGPAADGPGSSDPETPPVASIVVEGGVVMLWDAGLGTRLTARAMSSSGAEIPGVVFTWTTDDPTVATVVNGVVTATGDGWTEAEASAGGESGGVSIVVVTPEGPRDRTDCMACHADAFVGQHGGSNTPETCLQCHTGPAWAGGDLDHPAVANGFELLGAHALISCAGCHETDGTPKYPGVGDNQCIACHESDYDGQHAGSGYPTACLQCHTRDDWSGADFDHSAVSSGFDLLGAHSSLSCTACHEADGTPKYPGVGDNQCIACHESDYDGQHAGSGYPTACLTCHTRSSWSGADFDHDAQFFPISVGKHQGKWNGCGTCHTDSSDYSNFTCFACHQHDQGRMDDKHSDVSGYSYDSARCYACHPDGSD